MHCLYGLIDDKNWVDSYLPELEEIPPKEFERNDDYNSDENSLPFHVSFPKLSHDVMSNYQPKSLDKELSVGVSPLLSKHSSVSPSVSSGSINRIKSLSEVTNDESPHFLPNDSSRVLPLTATNLKLLPAGIALCHNKKK